MPTYHVPHACRALDAFGGVVSVTPRFGFLVQLLKVAALSSDHIEQEFKLEISSVSTILQLQWCLQL